MIYDALLDEVLHAVWDGQRIRQAEALRLYRLPLEELGAFADRPRQLARAAILFRALFLPLGSRTPLG